MKTLWDRLVPQMKEVIKQKRGPFPATAVELEELLQKSYHWIDLPFYAVARLYDFAYGIKDTWEQDKVRQLFEDYWNE